MSSGVLKFLEEGSSVQQWLLKARAWWKKERAMGKGLWRVWYARQGNVFIERAFGVSSSDSRTLGRGLPGARPLFQDRKVMVTRGPSASTSNVTRSMSSRTTAWRSSKGSASMTSSTQATTACSRSANDGRR